MAFVYDLRNPHMGLVYEMKLTRDFDSEEFGENLTVTYVQNYYLLCLLALQFVRDRFGPIHITSAYRTVFDQERLEQQGYHPSQTSQHLFGEAADFLCPTAKDMRMVYEYLVNELQWPGEVIYYPKRGHVHVALPHIGVKADHFINEEA